MNITPGKYRTRIGKEAIVAAIAPDELRTKQPVIGWIKNENSVDICSWCIDGKFYSNQQQSGGDLVTVWVDAPKLRPWKVEEVPLGYWIRAKGGENICLIIDTTFEARRLEWLIDYEHSTDGGKTWKPCGVEVKP